MKQFTSHIDYLIQKHDCVIIPDFGGFVLNRENAHISETGILIAPRVTVGFNTDLKYNDGLLAESYMNVYSISYDAACKKISEAVNRLNTILNFRQPVQIGNLGKLSLDSENHISFVPNNNLSLNYPETYGLSNLNIKRLLDIENIIDPVNSTKRKHPILRQIFTGVGAAAASVLIFFATSTPVADNQKGNMQMSGFLTPNIKVISANTTNETPMPSIANSSDKIVEEELEDIVVKADTVNLNSNKANYIAKQNETKVNEVEKAILKYYIIIGSPGNKKDAQTVLKRLKSQGFASANIIESADRSRIYIAAFQDKDEANKYLQSFRKQNPSMNDAWLFTKR